MGWQKQLRRLDSELAGGVISYGHYRKQRDAVLASISGTSASPQHASGPPPTASARARWTSTNPSSTRGEQQRTEPEPVVPPRQPTVEHDEPAPAVPAVPARVPAEVLASQRPRTAPSPADERPTESIPYPDLTGQPPEATTPLAPPNRTLPNQAIPTQPTPAQQPPQPRQPPPQQPTQPISHEHPSSPRALPVHSGQASKARQPTWAWLGLGLFALLALIIGGAWWLAERPTGSPAAAGAPPSRPAPPREVALEDRLPALPGRPAKDNSTMSVRKGLQLGLYPPETAAKFAQNGASEVVYRRSTNGSHAYLVMVIPTRTPQTAKATVDYLHASALGSGLTAQPIRGAAGVTGSNDTGRRSGSWYTSGELAVCTWVSTRLDSDGAALSARLARTVASVQEALPRR